MNRFLFPVFSLSLVASLVRAEGAGSSNLGTMVLKGNNNSLLAIDKSLVEREQERIEADSAMPEASPTTAPFSLGRPDSIV